MAKLAIRNLTKRYEGGALGLQDVSLEITTGEFVVLVGPSGCGKSTLLRSIAGLETPTSGRIEIDGRRVDDLPPAERGVGMVFQDYALYPHMSVRENLAFGLRARRMPSEEIEKRIAETTQMLELEALLDRKPAQLSGGQRQRVAIGRALVKRPSLFLLDEPLSNLDAQLRAQTRLEIASLHRRIQSTTLYVTHDQEEAMTLADRIVVLRAGQVQQVAPPIELYRNPVNRFVGSFIGSPRMNFLEGELKVAPPTWVFETGSARIPIPPAQRPLRVGRYTLGFRPEAFRLSERGVSVQLEWIEYHGFEVNLIGSIGTQRITLRTTDRDLPLTLRNAKPGFRFSIELDLTQIHWFETGGDQLRVENVGPTLLSSGASF